MLVDLTGLMKEFACFVIREPVPLELFSKCGIAIYHHLHFTISIGSGFT
jgi:hypothetical protein